MKNLIIIILLSFTTAAKAELVCTSINEETKRVIEIVESPNSNLYQIIDSVINNNLKSKEISQPMECKKEINKFECTKSIFKISIAKNANDESYSITKTLVIPNKPELIDPNPYSYGNNFECIF